MQHNALPSTITSTGRVVQTWSPGPDDNLPSLLRYAEAWHRLRKTNGRIPAALLLLAAWRFGFALS